MKKTVLTIAMLALLVPGTAFAVGVGVMVKGKCRNDIPIASSIQVDVMQASMAAAIMKMELSVVNAIGAQTAALQGAGTSTAGYLARMNAQAAATDIRNKGLEEKNNFLSYSIGADGICREDVPGTALIAADAHLNGGNRMFAEQDRNTGQGFFTNPNTGKPEKPKDPLAISVYRAKQAQVVEQNGQFFTQDPVFTPEQSAAWRQFTDLAMPPMQLPRGVLSSSSDSAEYKIAETKMREMRTIMTESFRQFGSDRYATIPAGPIYGWAGSGVPRPSTSAPKVNADGSINVKQDPIPIPDSGLLSKSALLNIIGNKYISEDFLTKLDQLNAAGVLKEQFRLNGYTFMVLLDIRNDLRHGNLLKSIELIPVLKEMQEEQAKILKTSAVR